MKMYICDMCGGDYDESVIFFDGESLVCNYCDACSQEELTDLCKNGGVHPTPKWTIVDPNPLPLPYDDRDQT